MILTNDSQKRSNDIVRQYHYGDGKRIKKVTNLETTVFVYSGGKLVAEYSTQISQTPTTSYLTSDTLGSPRVITNQAGDVVSRRDFMPFGEEIYAGIGGRDTATQKYSANDTVRQGFTGYQRDKETQLEFAEARYYNSAHGRFTAVDPLLASGKSSNPQTFNRYVYVMNNPLNSTDPSGMKSVYWYDNKDGTFSFSETYQAGWYQYRGDEQTITATNGNRYLINRDGITNLGNAATLDRNHALFTFLVHDQVIGGAKGCYNFCAGLANTPVTTPTSFPGVSGATGFGPSLHDLGVPLFFDRYEYNSLGESIHGFKAEIVLTIGSFFVGGEAGVASEATSAVSNESKFATVGRWMGETEYINMSKSGMVQESLTGTTHVANPASPYSFMNQAKPGSLYVEFDVPSSSLKATQSGWGKILGPNTIEGRNALRFGRPVPQMPPATNINPIMSRTSIP